MSAQTHSLHTVPEIDHSIRRRRQLRDLNPLPLVLAELHAEAEARHRRLVLLEALFAETPIWCVRQRWLIRKALISCQPSMWS